MHRYAMCSSEQPQEFITAPRPESSMVTGHRLAAWTYVVVVTLEGPQAKAHSSLYSTKTSSFLKPGSLPSHEAKLADHGHPLSWRVSLQPDQLHEV